MFVSVIIYILANWLHCSAWYEWQVVVVEIKLIYIWVKHVIYDMLLYLASRFLSGECGDILDDITVWWAQCDWQESNQYKLGKFQVLNRMFIFTLVVRAWYRSLSVQFNVQFWYNISPDSALDAAEKYMTEIFRKLDFLLCLLEWTWITVRYLRTSKLDSY